MRIRPSPCRPVWKSQDIPYLFVRQRVQNAPRHGRDPDATLAIPFKHLPKPDLVPLDVDEVSSRCPYPLLKHRRRLDSPESEPGRRLDGGPVRVSKFISANP